MAIAAADVLQSQDKDGMLRRALERIIQLYTDKSHFVYELLQNAEDSGAQSIKFIQHSDRLEVLHDGRPFTLKNLQGLCDIGKSDKIDNLNQIGEFGVGFKSVFGICEKVSLYSTPNNYKGATDSTEFAVEILDFTRPHDIPYIPVGKGYTTRFVFPYSVGFPFSGFESISKLKEALSQRLQNLGITTLLFMKSLEMIEYEIVSGNKVVKGSYMLDKQPINDHCFLISALGEGTQEKSEDVSYLKFSRKIDEGESNRTVDIAFPVTVSAEGEYEFHETKYPFISVYFPTETESKLNFIVQGPYRTTPNRSSVPSDNEDNIKLAKLTAGLLHDSILEIKAAGKLNLSLLRILPINRRLFYSYDLFEPLYHEVRKMLIVSDILPCKNGAFASSKQVRIARGQELTELFTDELLTELLVAKRECYWLPITLTETNKRYKELYEYLTDELDVDVIRPENLRNLFNENPGFLKARSDEWLDSLYSLCEGIEGAFSKNRYGSNMLTAVFIKTEKGNFVAPYRKGDSGTFIPNVFLPIEDISEAEDLEFVNSTFYSSHKRFFEEVLGLQKPNEFEFFLKRIQKRYSSNISLSDEVHIQDIKTILQHLSTPEHREQILSVIQGLSFIRCSSNGKIAFVNPFKTYVYFKTTATGIALEEYFKNVSDRYFVDQEFYFENGITYEDIKSLDVEDSILVGDSKTVGTYYTGNPGRQPDWHTSGSFRWELSIDKIDDVLIYIAEHPTASDSIIKSQTILKILFENEARLQGTVYIGGSTPNRQETSKIISTLSDSYGRRINGKYESRKAKWLFDKNGELVAHSEISKYDLSVPIYGKVKLDSNLYEILGFKKNETDHLEETIKDYDRISDEKKQSFFEIEFQRRYGISLEVWEANRSILVDESDSEGIDDDDPIEVYEFPSSRVKNWDALRKHAAEMYCFANPVRFDYLVRRIRTTRPVNAVKAYLMNMYRADGCILYACQMCHEMFASFEACQIETAPKVELEPMHLCMCPTCAAKFRKYRNNATVAAAFLEELSTMDQAYIEESNPVEVEIGDEIIWFTQSHIAEIVELLSLQAEDVEDGADNADKTPSPQAQPSSITSACQTTSNSTRVPANNPSPKNNEPKSVADYFQGKGIKVVDKRFSGGALWVMGSKEQIHTYVEEACKLFGITGQYGAGKASGFHPAWWTKDRK